MFWAKLANASSPRAGPFEQASPQHPQAQQQRQRQQHFFWKKWPGAKLADHSIHRLIPYLHYIIAHFCLLISSCTVNSDTCKKVQIIGYGYSPVVENRFHNLMIVQVIGYGYSRSGPQPVDIRRKLFPPQYQLFFKLLPILLSHSARNILMDIKLNAALCERNITLDWKIIGATSM